MDLVKELNISFPILQHCVVSIVDWTAGEGCPCLNVIMCSHLREGGRACLIGVTHTWGHFRNIGSKLGSDLTQARNSGQLMYRDFLTEQGKSIMTGELISLHSVYSWICAQVKDYDLLVIDDISCFLPLGYKTTDVLQFVHMLCTLPCSVLCGMQCCDSTKDGFLRTQLKLHSEVMLEAKPMISGESKAVDGWVNMIEFHYTQGHPQLLKRGCKIKDQRGPKGQGMTKGVGD